MSRYLRPGHSAEKRRLANSRGVYKGQAVRQTLRHLVLACTAANFYAFYVPACRKVYIEQM